MPFNFFKHHKKTNEKTYVTRLYNFKNYYIRWDFCEKIILNPEYFTISSTPPEFTYDVPKAPKTVDQKKALAKLKHRYVAVFDMNRDELKKVLLVNDIHYLGGTYVDSEFTNKQKTLKNHLQHIYLDVLNPENDKWMRIKDYSTFKLKCEEFKHAAGVYSLEVR